METTIDNDGFWGLDLAINLQNCDLGVIQSEEHLTIYLVEICDLMKMNRVGDPQFTYLSPTIALAGYTVVQLIETSSIIIHLCDQPQSAYFNLFSCREFNPVIVTKNTMQFFKTEECVSTALYRGPEQNIVRQIY